MSTTVRNVGIIVLIAAAVAFIPGGGNTANFVGALLSTLITAAFAYIGYRLYREHRMTIYALGDRWRGVMYGAIATAVLAMAAAGQLFEAGGAGILLWFVMVGGASYALFATWRHHRSYD